jgi:hypothetical protein
MATNSLQHSREEAADNGKQKVKKNWKTYSGKRRLADRFAQNRTRNWMTSTSQATLTPSCDHPADLPV